MCHIITYWTGGSGRTARTFLYYDYLYMVMILEVPKGREKGEWFGKEFINGKWRCQMVCPDCGKTFWLYFHDLAPGGIVHPSVVCFFKCGFHSHIKLIDWDPIPPADP